MSFLGYARFAQLPRALSPLLRRSSMGRQNAQRTQLSSKRARADHILAPDRSTQTGKALSLLADHGDC